MRNQPFCFAQELALRKVAQELSAITIIKCVCPNLFKTGRKNEKRNQRPGRCPEKKKTSVNRIIPLKLVLGVTTTSPKATIASFAPIPATILRRDGFQLYLSDSGIYKSNSIYKYKLSKTSHDKSAESSQKLNCLQLATK